MNFIVHPSYVDQCQSFELILSKLTLENMNKLVQPYEYECLSFQRLQTSGRVNLIFNLKCQTKTHLPIEFILKVCNPHCYWTKYRTKNEVYAMKYLFEHTNIPIPKILDYSDDVNTSVLSCEYILMEKINEPTLESVIDQLSDEILIQIALKITDYVQQLRQIKFSHINQIGSFSSREMLLGGTIEDGPILGPFKNLQEYLIKHLQWSIRRIQTDEQLNQLANHLIVSLEQIIEIAKADPNLLNEQIQYRFTHTDLNSSNIFIDLKPGQIKAIVDWEKCAMTFNDQDIEFFSGWFDDQQKEQHFQSILHQHLSYSQLFKEKCVTQNIKSYLDVMYSAMYATFYSSTWFDCEQTVIKHIKYFFEETENAICQFKQHFIQSKGNINECVNE